MFFSQTHNILLDPFCLEINGNQNIVFAVFGRQFQNFINDWNLLSSKFGIKPTTSVKAADFLQR
jgi:hypothetical protein